MWECQQHYFLLSVHVSSSFSSISNFATQNLDRSTILMILWYISPFDKGSFISRKKSLGSYTLCNMDSSQRLYIFMTSWFQHSASFVLGIVKRDVQVNSKGFSPTSLCNAKAFFWFFWKKVCSVFVCMVQNPSPDELIVVPSFLIEYGSSYSQLNLWPTTCYEVYYFSMSRHIDIL